MRLLADIVIPGHHFGITSEPAPGSDAFVLMTLSFLVFLFIGFALGGYILWRRSQHPAPHLKLLMELEDEEATEQLPKTEPAEPEPKTWEREADWWKK